MSKISLLCGFNILLILLSLCNYIIILKGGNSCAIDVFTLPEGEDEYSFSSNDTHEWPEQNKS